MKETLYEFVRCSTISPVSADYLIVFLWGHCVCDLFPLSRVQRYWVTSGPPDHVSQVVESVRELPNLVLVFQNDILISINQIPFSAKYFKSWPGRDPAIFFSSASISIPFPSTVTCILDS